MIIFIPRIFFHILDWLGPNFNAINLKFSQIVGHEVVYKISKFRTNNSKIKVSRRFFIPRRILPHFGSARPQFLSYQPEIFT